jgi:uncharacterized protein (TIGR03435 family)
VWLSKLVTTVGWIRKGHFLMVGRSRRVDCCNLLRATVIVVATATAAFGQSNATSGTGVQTVPKESSLPEFEVATIKPSNPLAGIIGVLTYPGGKVTIGHCTTVMLMGFAFDVQQYQILGAPSWALNDQYDIAAVPPASSTSSSVGPRSPKSPLTAEQKQMLQALLIDRYQLKFHTENRTGTVYRLILGREKLKLKPPNHTDSPPWVGSPEGGAIHGTGVVGANISMTVLSSRLGRYLLHPVLDETGLKGTYDFEYRYSSDNSRDDLVPSILTSLRAVGLDLKTGNGPIETIVIDRIEKPSAN